MTASSCSMNIICTLLYAYCIAGAQAYSSAHFGEGNGGIFLSNVRCSGTEPALLNCTHDGIGVHVCGHSRDAGVSCLGKLQISEIIHNLLNSLAKVLVFQLLLAVLKDLSYSIIVSAEQKEMY